MTKSDLRTGMLVRTRSNDYYYVMLNTNLTGDEKDILVHRCGDSMGWMPLSQYHEDMTFHSMPDDFFDFSSDPDVDKAWDIVQVLAVNHAVDFFRQLKYYHSIWKRSES